MRSTTIASVLFLAAGVIASPVTERHPEQYIHLDEVQVKGGGSLEFLGPEPTKATRSLNIARKVCAYNPQPSCSSENNANNELCSKLVDNLYATSRNPISKAPRQVCYKENDSYCCTSWSAEVSGLTQGDLADNANAIFKQCVQNGISGQLNGVKLSGVCMDQCLSNRGTGCA
ncbi:hypothetical protein GGR54DRAFT_611399 [Hypoxylon sp. NC1633]|nr:hypothetical protein GGR54DRAFT_611399 [Hypoxylon sp. NC1633]